MSANQAPPALDLAQLRRMDREQLEALYRDHPCGPSPEGRYRGELLPWIPGDGASRRAWRVSEWLGFRLLPWGVDFTLHGWFFVWPWLRMGRFVARRGRSRWRETETFALGYESSRLPGTVRKVLYDEVKSLGPDLCLGMGGINAERGRGDHFFFALTRTLR